MQKKCLDKLRAQINRIERRTTSFHATAKGPLAERDKLQNHSTPPLPWTFGISEVDRFFVNPDSSSQGLSIQALHEITPQSYQDSRAALSFALALLARRLPDDKRPVLWCLSSSQAAETGRPYGYGLQSFALDPARVILIEGGNNREINFVLEEALKYGRLAAVLGQIDELDFTASRRLSLMASRGQTPALLITRPQHAGIRTAATRWQIARPTKAGQNALGQSHENRTIPLSLAQPLHWQVALVRNRYGPADKQWPLAFSAPTGPSRNLHPTSNPVEYCHEQTFRFHLSSPSGHREIQASEQKVAAA